MENGKAPEKERFLHGAVLYRVRFPDFWKTAYARKNRFYGYLRERVVRYVEMIGEGQEYLEGEKVKDFWHEHCAGCWDRVKTDYERTYYCTRDFAIWFCEKCYEENKTEMDWTTGNPEDCT